MTDTLWNGRELSLSQSSSTETSQIVQGNPFKELPCERKTWRVT